MKLIILVCVLAALALHVNAGNTVCTRDWSGLNEQEHPEMPTLQFEDSWGFLRKDVDLKSHFTKVKASSLQACFQKCLDMNDQDYHNESGECWTFSYERTTKNCYMSQGMIAKIIKEGSPHQALCPKKGFVAGYIDDIRGRW